MYFDQTAFFGHLPEFAQQTGHSGHVMDWPTLITYQPLINTKYWCMQLYVFHFNNFLLCFVMKTIL